MNKDKKYQNNSDEVFLKNRSRKSNKERDKRVSKLIRILNIIMIVLAVITPSVVGAYFYLKNSAPTQTMHNQDSELFDQAVVNDNTAQNNPLVSERYSFLAVGTDQSQSLTDVIIIATYDINNKNIALVQIPRDTHVKVSTKLILDDNASISKDNFDKSADKDLKINTVYSHARKLFDTTFKALEKECKNKSLSEIEQICSKSCISISAQSMKDYLDETNQANQTKMYNSFRDSFGMKYLSILLYYNFGVPVDFYAKVNTSGFRKIVDAIGGVDVVIQQDMDYEDPDQDLYIHLKKGPQHLDGKKAEQFVRFRHGYVQADIARMDAQKIFMTAFIKKVFSIESISKYDDIVEQIQKNLSTNLSLQETLYFATNVLDIDFSQIVMITLPGQSEYIGEVSYYLPGKDAVIQTVNTYLNKYKNPLTADNFCFEDLTNGSVSSNTMTAQGINDKNPSLNFVTHKPSIPDQQDDLLIETEDSKADEALDSSENTEQADDQQTSESTDMNIPSPDDIISQITGSDIQE